MQNKIIKAFFDGTLSDETIRPPRSEEYKKIARLHSKAITKKIARKIFREEERQRSSLAMC